MKSIELNIQLSYGTALAVLRAKLYDLHLAEDALQHACLVAIEKWTTATPKNPKAWLIRVALNHAIDEFRKDKRTFNYFSETESVIDEAYQFEDAILGLIFCCCHPTISVENQIAITLKLAMGFHEKEISRALIIPLKTLEQRITRTKRKIVKNQLDFSLPAKQHLNKRLPAVIKVLYLLFNEGYHSSNGDCLFIETLCHQAIGLTRSLSRVYRGQSNILALLSLMLFSVARMPSRSETSVINLKNQDRSLWDKNLINQADILLQKSLKMGEVSQYHIEAAISGIHSLSKNYQSTDWHQIVLLYDKLLTYNYSPIVIVNQAVAYMMQKDYFTAEEKLRSVEVSLMSYCPYFIALAMLKEGISDYKAAIEHYNKAIELSHNPIEINYLKSKLKKIEINQFD